MGDHSLSVVQHVIMKTRSRDPIITQPDENGGEPCPPTETEPCNEGPCPGDRE